MKVHSALQVTALASGINFVVSFAATVAIARLLSPGEIGIHSIAISLIAFTHILREFGVVQYFLQLKVLDRDHLRAGFTAMLMISWTIAVALLVLATPVGQFYGHDGVGEVFRVLAVSFLVLPFGSYILSQLRRELRFDLLAGVQIATTSFSACVSVLFAWHGYSYLSMALGTVLGNVFTVVLLSSLRPRIALLLPSTRHLGEVFRFGGFASSASLANQAGHSAPDLVFGKTLSSEAVAHFSRASSLLNMLATKVDEIVIQVFTPTFADRLRAGVESAEALARAVRLHSGVAMPLLATLAAVGEPLTVAVFGPQWHLAASLAPWILGYAIVSAPVTLAPHALVAGGHVRAALSASLTVNAVLVAVLLLSVWLDLAEVVIYLVLVRLVMLVAWARRLETAYGFGLRRLLAAVAPSLGLLAATGGAAVLTRLGLRHLYPSASDLMTVSLVCFAALLAYLGALRAMDHPLRTELSRVLPVLRLLLGR